MKFIHILISERCVRYVIYVSSLENLTNVLIYPYYHDNITILSKLNLILENISIILLKNASR